MAVQFAGSSSTGDRRRRRLVVNGDGPNIDSSMLDGDGADIESQLVASAAAAPWVPVAESRIWIYVAVIGLLLAGLTYALMQPANFPADVSPITDHLLTGARPILAIFAEVVLLGLSAQLGLLIGRYRSRGKLDFSGRYRFWPWAVGLIAATAFCQATNTHRAVGLVAERIDLLPWRAATVVWLLPVCIAALPIALFLDRDIRHSRSSLWTIRLSIALWLSAAWLEVFRPELQSSSWFDSTTLLLPLFASVTLFVGLWLHARIVAYVCPDPPELAEQTAWQQLQAVFGWTLGRLMFWRRSNVETEDEEEKPKRRRKKTETEETATRRKRKAPVKRASPRTRTRSKTVEDETVEQQEDIESAADESEPETEVADDASNETATNSWDHDQQAEENWEEDAAEETPPPSNRRISKNETRVTQIHKSHGSSPPAPHSRRQQTSWEEESLEEATATSSGVDSNATSNEDDQESDDQGLTAEQTKGLSKRQKRELRKQLREQERSRGR